jgi:hypothetical protein
VPNYQRIAVLILRITGAIWFGFFAVMWGLHCMEMAIGVTVQHYPTHTIIGAVAYICLGLLLVLAAKPLVNLLARGLDG